MADDLTHLDTKDGPEPCPQTQTPSVGTLMPVVDCPHCVMKPSCHVCNILEGKGSATEKGDQTLSKGLCVLKAVEGEVDSTSSDTVILAVTIANIEGLEPQTIEEACRHLDWPRWSEAIKEVKE